MAGIFLKIVNMSISACWIILVILLFRLVLKKAPKWINCVLWGLAGLRLVLPFSFESVFSLIPSAETITKAPDSPRPQINSGVPVIDNQINGYLQGNYFEGVTRPVGNFVDINTIFAIIWIVGIAALLIYTLVSFLRLKSKIGTAVKLSDNIYQSEAVVSPFALGIIKPKIYLPFNMNGQNMEHVIAHEQAHIRRKDHLWKPLGFLILTLHWFNPMVWLGYILLCRDIELACDEKVVKELNNEQRADYSEALLTCSVNRRMIAACPLAFGEVGVKDRIKSVLNYKKPAFWVIIVAVITIITVAVCFLTNPVKSAEIQDGSYKLSAEIYFNGMYSYVPNFENDSIEIKTNGGMHIYHFTGEVLSTGGLYEEIKLNKENFLNLFDSSTEWSKYENAGELLKNNKSAWYHSIPQDFYGHPYILLLQKDGSLYVAFADLENGTPTRVRYIYELEYEGNIENSYDSSVGGYEKLTWSYNPSLSHTSHYTRAFAFDGEYTHVDATCMGGEFWNLEAEGQPRGTNMRFEKGKKVYWTPAEDDENPTDKSEVTFTVYNGDTKMQQHTVIFECVSRNYSTGDVYEFYLKDSTEFVLVYSEYGYLTFVERSSISNVGGADEPSNFTVSTIIDGLKVKYPQFFNVSTDGGLTVYIWQMSENNYSCYLANTSMEAISDNSFAYDVGASIAEMRAILTTYDIEQKDIVIHPVNNPLSSYYYEIDDNYRARIKELFWKDSYNITDYFHVTEQEENEKIDLVPMVMVDGVLYLDTGFYSTYSLTNRTYDGEITSAVKANEKPTQNNQSNFETNLGYVIGSLEGTIEIHMNDMWRIFATEDVRQKLQFPDNT